MMIEFDILQPRHCAVIGVIQDKETRPIEDYPMPLAVPFIGLPNGEPAIDLEWAENPPSPPAGYRLSEDFSSDSDQSGSTQRAFTLIEPVHLRRIEACVNTYPGRYGLKALRFSGNRRMGPVLLGDWTEEDPPAPEHTMIIEGVFSSDVE